MPTVKKSFANRNSKRKTENVAADNELDMRHGSRRRILELTSAPNPVVAETLSSLIEGHGTVGSGDLWSPRGANAPSPIRLDEATGFIKDPMKKSALREWWISGEPLFNRAMTQRQTAGRASRPMRLPAFDLVSTFGAEGSDSGILIVSAAAHIGELNSDHAHQREKTALPQIKKAFAEASAGWNALLLKHAEDYGYKLSHRVKLSTEAHYRLATHFAFAWKLAQLGVPVILLYLGFLDATELEPDGRLIFRDGEMWNKCVFEKTSKPLPEEIWDASFDVPDGAKITVLRKTMRIFPA